MSRVLGYIAILVCAHLLSGCTTLYTRQECQDINWKEEGFKFGAWGEPNIEDRISHYNKNCKIHGVQPDIHSLRLGYIQGLAKFCSQEKTQANMDLFRPLCSRISQAPFLKSYQTINTRKLLRDIKRLEAELNSKKAQLELQSKLDSKSEK